MADEKEKVEEAEEADQDEEVSDGPQPTPSVPPEPVMVTEPEDEEVEKADQKEHGATLQTISTLLTQLTTLVEAMQSEGYDTEDSAEDVEVELDGMDEDMPKPMTMKSGRVLSSKNELKIKAARAHLDEVMKSIYKQPSESKPSGMPVSKSLDYVVMNIIEDVVAEPTFTIDTETMKSAIADAVKSQITIPAMESFQRAINLARGRVH